MLEGIFFQARRLLASQGGGTLLEMLEVVLMKAQEHSRTHPQWPVLHLPSLIGRAFGLADEAIEPLQLANLLFFCYADITDDAEDADLEGWPWGWPQAVNLGNALLFLTFYQLRREAPPLLDRYVQAGISMTSGQALDLRNALPYRITLDEYLRSVEGKTGASVSAYASAPAILARQPAPIIEALSEYGKNLGMVLQLVSDVREVWQTPAGPDLKNGRLTLPLLCALERVDEAECFRLLEGIREGGAVEPLHALLEQSGVRLYVEMKIELFRRRARKGLEVLDAHPLREALEALLDLPAFAKQLPLL